MSFEAADKVSADHLRRDAYLYVRQSTLRQVMENTTSTQRQYGLRHRALALGWPAGQVVVIDDDLGRSGATAEGRDGFQRLVADVGMGKAGIVLGLEVSRLARNNADWHRLLEICALTQTLILDEDGLYDPCTFNDRLLLGLKGQMSEAELHLLRARLRGGVLSKARRGELASPLPVGFVYDPAGKVVFDPDASVRQAIGHLFATFTRTGSARATVQAFTAEGVLFPLRVRTGPNKGTLTWTPLRHHRVLQVLHNPRYAGAFVFGRRTQRKGPDGTIRYHLQARDQWLALIPDAHAGYISWTDYEANQARLAESAQARGQDRRASPPREGPALLQGLVLCGRCGDRMTVRYHHRGELTVPDYNCQRNAISAGTPACTSIPGQAIDRAISSLLLETVTPLALEVALTVQAELEARAAEADQLRRADVDRARHAAELARRRYLAVDPGNRLVAATLEADWNDALRQLSAAAEDYERRSTAARALTDGDRAKITALAADFPALWSDPRTPDRERKRMVRLLLDDVTLARKAGGGIAVHARFKGGQTTSLTIPAPLTAPDLRRTPAPVIAAIDTLLDQHTDAAVAAALNQAGTRSGTGQPFTAGMIRHIRHAHQLASREHRLRANGLAGIGQTASRLGVSHSTIKKWAAEGRLDSEIFNDKGERLYLIPAVAPFKPAGRPPKTQRPAETLPDTS
jgi:DNA invertase Pin-like site-specific DNA recombinase